MEQLFQGSSRVSCYGLYGDKERVRSASIIKLIGYTHLANSYFTHFFTAFQVTETFGTYTTFTQLVSEKY